MLCMQMPIRRQKPSSELVRILWGLHNRSLLVGVICLGLVLDVKGEQKEGLVTRELAGFYVIYAVTSVIEGTGNERLSCLLQVRYS